MKKTAKKLPGKMAGLKTGKPTAKAKKTPNFLAAKKTVKKYAAGGSVARGMGAAKRGGNYSEC